MSIAELSGAARGCPPSPEYNRSEIMKTARHFPLEGIHPLLWHFFCLGLSLAAFSLILLNRSPNFLRPLSMSLRSGFGLVIPATVLLTYLALRLNGRLGELAGLPLSLTLFALPLAGAWASGHTQSVLLMGILPISDASNYYEDGLKILSRLEISHFSAMRPLFPATLSLLLAITNRNLMVSHGILTAVAGFTAYRTAREVRRTHGPAPATLLLIILFLYYRHHAGTTMSEALGMSVGVMGAGLIWRGLADENRFLSLFGLFVLALALNIRPGTMFVLPFTLVWIGWCFRGSHRVASPGVLILGAALVFSAFAYNSVLIRLLADPSGTAFSNFSWALYGLASGGHSFNYIFEVHPELLLIQDPEQSRTIYRMAFDLILNQPGLFVQGLWQRWSFFFSDTWYAAFSFVSGENPVLNRFSTIGLYLFSALGLIGWFLKPGARIAGFVALAAAGVLLSVPFVPPTDAYRVRLYAATIVLFGLLPGLGLHFLVERLRPEALPQTVNEAPLLSFWSVPIVLLILAAPLLARTRPQAPPNPGGSTCPGGLDQAIIHFDPGTSINILRQNQDFLDWMPDFHWATFQNNIHDLADGAMIQFLGSLNPGQTLMHTLDYRSGIGALVILPTDDLPPPGTWMSLCGERVTDAPLSSYKIFLVRESHPMDE